MSFNPGDVIAEKYRIVGMIGRGGVGEVYEGENLRIRRKVAIKTLRAEFDAKSDIVQRFEREAQAAGRIGSKHIVEVLDLGDLPDGSRYLVMEHLEGTTLSKQIKQLGRMTAIDTAQLLLQLLEGLGGAHAAGIVHRDLKPANIFILRKAGEPFVKILDFGVSKFNTLASDELTMTKTGMVVGTPYYMAPEQAKGARSVDGRADLYAVGVIAYECVTGQVPFSAQTFNELLFKIVLETPPPLETFAPELDPHFSSLVRKAMNREPNQRFQTAAEFQAALSDWLVQMTSGKLGMTLANTRAFVPGPSSNAATAILPPDHATAARVAAAVAVAQTQAAGSAVPQPGPAPLGNDGLGGAAVGGGGVPGARSWETSGAGDAPSIPRRSLLPLILGGIGLAVAAALTFLVVRLGDDTDATATTRAAPTEAPLAPGDVAAGAPAPTVVSATPEAAAPVASDGEAAPSAPPVTSEPPAPSAPVAAPPGPPTATPRPPGARPPPPATSKPPPPPAGPSSTGTSKGGRPISGDL